MIFFIFFFLFAVFVSLFTLYLLSKNDFILLRKGISLLNVFNLNFIGLMFAFILGRLFYVLEVSNFDVLHIIKFFHVFRYPGFSILGGFLGGILGLLLFNKDNKAFLRIFDISLLSFFPIFYLFIIVNPNFNNFLIVKLMLLLFYIIIYITLLNCHKSFKFRDGNVGLTILSLISIFSLMASSLNIYPLTFKNVSIFQIVNFVVLVLTVALMILNKSRVLIR